MISKHQTFLPISNPTFLSLYVAPHTMRTLLLWLCLGFLSKKVHSKGNICGKENKQQKTHFYVSYIYEFLQNNRSLRNKDMGKILSTKGINTRILDSPWAMKFSVGTVPGSKVRFGYFLQLMPKSFMKSSLQLGMAKRLSSAAQVAFQLEEARKVWKEHILEQ